MADAMVSQGINYGLKAIEISLSTTSTVADIIYQALKMFDNDKAISSMNKLIKNNQTEYIMCDVDEMETLRKRLESRGVGIDPETGKRQEGALSIITKDELGNERGMIVFNKKYHSLVLNTVREFQAEREGGLVDPKTLLAYSQGMTKEIKGIDKYELMLFDKQAKAYRVPYSIDGPENGLYSIRFGDRDQDEMERIKIDTATIMTGCAKDVYRKHLAYENDNFLKLRYMAINGIDRDTDKNVEKGSVIVDRTGKTIIFESNGVRCTDLFNEKVCNRHSPNYTRDVNDFICEMQKPVLLSEENYKLYKQSKNKEQFLINAERKLGCPELTQDDLELIAKEKKERDIIEGKLSKEHPVVMRDRLDDLNLEESVFTFSEKEKQNYEYCHDKSEDIHVDANFYDDAESKYVGWETEDCNKTLDDLEIEEVTIEGHAPSNENIEEDILINEMSQSQDDLSPHPDIEH